MPANDRGGLKAAFANFSKVEAEKEAERKLLGREIEAEQKDTSQHSDRLAKATTQLPHSGLIPRPMLHREPLRQLSFRCPQTLSSELRRKAAFNQLEQQQIIIEGLRRVLAELSDPPEGWEE